MTVLEFLKKIKTTGRLCPCGKHLPASRKVYCNNRCRAHFDLPKNWRERF